MVPVRLENRPLSGSWQSNFAIYGRRTDQAHHCTGIEGALSHYVQILRQSESHILEYNPRHQIWLVDDMAQVVLTVS